MTTAMKRQPIYCDCCESQIVGYREENRIIWFINTTKGRHTKVIDLNSIDKSDRECYKKSTT